MEMFYKIFAVLVSIYLVWAMYRFIRLDSGKTLNKENASKTFILLGTVGLGLIILVGFAVMALRAG